MAEHVLARSWERAAAAMENSSQPEQKQQPEMDAENPEVVNPLKSRFFRADPAFPTTMISVCVNLFLSAGLLFSVTANRKFSMYGSLVSIPITAVFCIRDAQRDFENWEKTRKYRIRGMPKQVMPYKVRFDWTDYEDVILERREWRMRMEADEAEAKAAAAAGAL